MGVDGGALLSEDIVLLFPGQGSQKPGMGRDLAERYPRARAVFEEADRSLAVSLSELCFNGPEERLTETQNAQPALLMHGAAVWAVVKDEVSRFVRAAAGHSLGEFTAYYAAGSFTFSNAVRLVRRRGELMYEGGNARPGAMAAILGLEEPLVEAVCQRASDEAGIVVPANYNTMEQLVISGEVAGVERAMALAREAGAKRAIRLKVSGAFHSPLMHIATDGLRAALDVAGFVTPAFPVYSNVTGQASDGAESAKGLLLRQLTSPVQWTAETRNLAGDYPDALFVEMGPGNVLSNLVKRIAPAARTMTCGTAPEVDELLKRVA